jgi:hypothetical protein
VLLEKNIVSPFLSNTPVGVIPFETNGTTKLRFVAMM